MVVPHTKSTEFAGVLTWQNRITRIRERCHDLFGRDGWRWRVIRTSNAYVFQDPNEAVSAGFRSKSDQRTGTPDQRFQDIYDWCCGRKSRPNLSRRSTETRLRAVTGSCRR